ncbi:MAG: hypothetical protein CSA15_00050 [Candidatus Delongbacteria bacterium]|nr:MAG: hypothetical protein CSB02_00710 [Bacteroidia bacterium]PIE82122.1 MAG: hypothetical protein CSA15_00050 [Candidatus Delongbacteria bacterium]
MSYTIRINNTNSNLAKNLLWYLKSLTETSEYDFLQIIEEDEDILSDEQKKELDNRYKHFLNHYEEYQDWETVKNQYIKK